MRVRRRLPFLLAAATVVAVLPSSAGAMTFRGCGQPGFGCATLKVPLDRTGTVPGTVKLRIAAQTSRKARSRKGVLVALSGGPGQGGADFAQAFALSLQPALSKYRLVTLDTRGTGGSGVINCPSVQHLGSLAIVSAQRIAACADKLGPRRAFYSTRDTVEDIDALRRALKAPKIALMGVSYGTFVAQQYARVHPDTTDRLILDSVVPADGPNTYLLDSYQHLRRVVAEQCAHGRCDGIAKDPLGDIKALVDLLGRESIKGYSFDAAGRRRPVSYHQADEIFNLVQAADLNPFLQAALPGAIHSAVTGDTAPLLRLRKIADGGSSTLADLSYGLNVTTSCLDVRLPYTLTTPLGDRPALVQSATDAIDPAIYAPFTPEAIYRTSYAEDCLLWPTDFSALPSTDPLPDVPALLLGGRLDIRTPLENAKEVAKELPRSSVVSVAGTGHDILDSDLTLCAARALKRFIADKRVGTPCKGHSNQVEVLPPAPRSLSDYSPAPGVRGVRGRIVLAVSDAAEDARVTVLQRLYAGLNLDAGGLHGGTMHLEDTIGHLHRWAYAPGVRLSGVVEVSEEPVVGRLRIDGPGRMDGRLTLHDSGLIVGRIGGRRVRYSPRSVTVRASSASAAARRAPLRTGVRGMPAAWRLRALRLAG
jgi:pimeloyl-ACP methyl ester carboxylesterase